MGTLEDPFRPLLADEGEAANDIPSTLRDVTAGLASSSLCGATVVRLHGFDLLDQPLVGNLPQWPGELFVARSTVALRRTMAGAEALVVFDNGDIRRPIIVGMLQKQSIDDGAVDQGVSSTPAISVDADHERCVIQAEREIVLRCGEASITLTRAGKVIIQGSYVLSRSTGYNKIKGAAIDIN